jgi:hypothetical protein
VAAVQTQSHTIDMKKKLNKTKSLVDVNEQHKFQFMNFSCIFNQ